VETTAEDSVGEGQEGDRQVEGPVDNTGLPGRWEVQLGGAGLPFLDGCGKAGAGGGGHSKRCVGGGAAGVAGGAGGEGPGAG